MQLHEMASGVMRTVSFFNLALLKEKVNYSGFLVMSRRYSLYFLIFFSYSNY
jgi:hypothetical protein